MSKLIYISAPYGGNEHNKRKIELIIKSLVKSDKGNKCFLWFNHWIVYKKGLGFICRICGKPKGQCND